MMRTLRRTLVLPLVATSAATAQVGYVPERSPYRDLDRNHELSLLTGHFRSPADPARVAPVSGPIMGFRYNWLISGPANLSADVARVGTFRRVLDPLFNGTCAGREAKDCKMVSTYRWPLYFADLGLALNLTGSRSYRRLVPEVRAGAGFLTDFHTKADVGDFRIGNRFVLSYGAGLRLVTRSRVSARVDLGNRLYPIAYPESYYTPAPDTTRIRPPLSDRSVWLNTTSFTFGLTYLFGR